MKKTFIFDHKIDLASYVSTNENDLGQAQFLSKNRSIKISEKSQTCKRRLRAHGHSFLSYYVRTFPFRLGSFLFQFFLDVLSKKKKKKKNRSPILAHQKHEHLAISVTLIKEGSRRESTQIAVSACRS